MSNPALALELQQAGQPKPDTVDTHASACMSTRMACKPCRPCRHASTLAAPLIFPVFTMQKGSPWGHLGVTFFDIFRHFSDFFRDVPGMFPGCSGIIERSSRTLPGVFSDTFRHFFGSCPGRSPGIFPALPDSFRAFFEKTGLGGLGV